MPAINARPLKLLLEGGGSMGGHMYDRQRCREKCESLIPHFNYSKIIRGSSFLISFIRVP